MWRDRVPVAVSALVLMPVPTQSWCMTWELIRVWEPPVWHMCLSGTWKLMNSKRILIFPQCISDFDVPSKGKGFTKGAGEIFPEVHLSLEQLVSLDLLYREWRKGVTTGNRCLGSPQRSFLSLFTIESPRRLNFPVKLTSCKAALLTHDA